MENIESFVYNNNRSEGGVKMKGNKKVLVAALLLLLISVSFTTYAIYRTSMSGSGSATGAGWSIKFKNSSGTEVNTLNFSGTDVHWTINPSAVAGKIAPGAQGYIDFTIDATGSEVDVYYLAELGSGATDGITVSMSDTSGTALSGEQLLAYAASNMKTTVRVNVAWAGALSDTAGKDSSDMALAGQSINIPITITARQSLENKTGVGA